MQGQNKNKKRFITTFIIVAMFVVFVLVYFYGFHYLNQGYFHRKVVTNYEEQMIKPELSLEKDIDRFLQVYFNQEFQNFGDKENFIKIEHQRFSHYPFIRKADQELGRILVANLGRILDKIEQQNLDFTAEEAELKKLQGELK